MGGGGGFADVGDIGREFHDHGHAGVLLAPAGDHLDIFGDLAHGAAHAAFGHAMRAAEVQFDPVGAGFLDQGQDGFPRLFDAGHHEGDDHGAVRVVAFDRFDLLQVHLERAVGDQFDVVEAQKPAIRAPDRAVARAVDVDHRGASLAQRFPHDPAPACLKGAADVVFLVGGRRGGQPEGVGGFDPCEFGCEIGHSAGLPLGG